MSHQKAETPHCCRLKLRWLSPKWRWSWRRSKSAAVSGLCNRTSPSRRSRGRKRHQELQHREGFELKQSSKSHQNRTDRESFPYKTHKTNVVCLKCVLNTTTPTAAMLMRCAAASAHQTATFISSVHNGSDVIQHNWRLFGISISERQLWALQNV